MIRLKNIKKQYGGVVAVQDVSLIVRDGSMFGVIGKSGAGKSSLLRVMSLLEKPTAGEVFYGDERVDALTGKRLLEYRRKMGMIFQNFNLLSSRDTFGNVAYPLEITGMSRKMIYERVCELLEMVGVADKRKSRMKELSGGQKQRVAIARALAVNPDTLFCDEATSALDPQTTRSILTLIKELHEKFKFTVVLITHQMSVVTTVCDEIAVMDQGFIVEQGSVAGVFTNPQSQAAKELLC
ncbi:MAG: ATP-binding cassette domain-containing protein [Treponema sp.]|jgi:D-methionine transport system ATP-binding protein|nr:ATP-binding cassette domain-containing protein [Treponema sp.]